jgi:hypothetical protein
MAEAIRRRFETLLGLIGTVETTANNALAAVAAKANATDLQPTIRSIASSATLTPTFTDDQINLTAQAANLTIANATGTPLDGWSFGIRIKDNGTPRSITFGSQYRAVGVTLPTTTVAGKLLYIGAIYNAADTKWDVVGVLAEA